MSEEIESLEEFGQILDAIYYDDPTMSAKKESYKNQLISLMRSTEVNLKTKDNMKEEIRGFLNNPAFSDINPEFMQKVKAFLNLDDRIGTDVYNESQAHMQFVREQGIYNDEVEEIFKQQLQDGTLKPLKSQHEVPKISIRKKTFIEPKMEIAETPKISLQDFKLNMKYKLPIYLRCVFTGNEEDAKHVFDSFFNVGYDDQAEAAMDIVNEIIKELAKNYEDSDLLGMDVEELSEKMYNQILKKVFRVVD